jgi:hypothetical protein
MIKQNADHLIHQERTLGNAIVAGVLAAIKPLPDFVVTGFNGGLQALQERGAARAIAAIATRNGLEVGSNGAAINNLAGFEDGSHDKDN